MMHSSCAQVVLLGSKMGSIGDGRTGGGLVRLTLRAQHRAHCGCMRSGSLLSGSQRDLVKLPAGVHLH